MSEEICERCLLCKWWDYDNRINVRRFDKDIQGYHCADEAALCLYKEPPPIHSNFYHTEVHTSIDYVCSGFLIKNEYSREVVESKKEKIGKGTIDYIKDKDMDCDVCHKKAEELITFDYDEDEEPVEICEKCLKKATKKLKEKK